MAALLTPEPLPRRALPATVEAAAEYKPAALRRAEAQILHRIDLDRLYSTEPLCTCTQTDVDLFDARGCELHDPNSSWNVRYRALTMVERYQQYEPAGTGPVECPF